MDQVFHALSHATRRAILDVVQAQPGSSVHDVCDYFEISRIGVMKHLRVLEKAGLLLSEKKGRTRRLYFNAVPIQMIYDRWTTEYSAFWAGGLTRIKYRIEAERKGRAATGSLAPPARQGSASKELRKRHA
ncbi:MAG: helix-turn-helix transcriptional regulator [Planctomycetia bacterium]|nr:helix-turn-helix transcriptional regulator [Planctomycetia bacterium]